MSHSKGFLFSGIIISLFSFLPFTSHALTAPPGFQVQTIVSGLNKPTVMAFVPDGRIFIAEKEGTIVVVKNGVLLPTPLIQLTDLNTNGDHALLGMALDPNFSQNGYLYLSYTYENSQNNYYGPKTGRIVRVTVTGDTTDESTKVVLVGKVGGNSTNPSCNNFPVGTDCIPSDSPSHSMGALKFGPDGMLYASTGDGSDFAKVDLDALRSQNIDVLSGKILRLNPDGTGPTDNPFYNGDPNANRSKVWTFGMRNAYRFNFRPTNSTLYIGDVGWKTWEEINIGKKGANYGWPCREGFFAQPEYNCTASSSTTDPIYAYDHPLGTAAVTGGSFPLNNVYPSNYMQNYFFGDVTTNVIKRMVVDANDNFVSVSDFFDGASGPVDVETGPDGNIYFLAIYTGQLKKIIYTQGNQPPVATIRATPLTGSSPLTVNFSSNSSNDVDNDVLTYAWDFGDSATSSQPNPQHIYVTDGNYTATLIVNDGNGLTDTKSVVVRVGASQNNNVIPHHIKTIVSPTPSYIGRDADITSSISNSGAANPFIVDMEIYDQNNTKVAQKTFENDTIPTNTNKDYSFSWFPAAIGNYRVAVGLFQQNWSGLYEWNNDAFDLTIQNRAPTTTLTDFKPLFQTVTANPATVSSGQTTAVTASVSNSGGAGSGLVDFEIYKDGNKVGQQFFDNVQFAQNETKSFVYNWTSGIAGTYQVSVGLFKPGWSDVYSWNPNVGQIIVSDGSNGGGGGTGTNTPLVIYDDTLLPGWQNWSWDTTTDFSSTITAFSGSNSINLNYASAYAGLYLHSNSLDTTGHSILSFALNGGMNGGENIQILMYDANGNVFATKNISQYLPSTGAPAHTWIQISIPLTDLQAQNKTISGIAIQNANGPTQSPFFIDSIQLK